MKETRKLYSNDLRSLCIEKNWYTKGANTEYASLLDAVDEYENITTQDIVDVARNILIYSDTEYQLENVCFEIARRCYSYFE